MPSELIRIITSDEPAVRDTALEAVCRRLSLAELLEECAALEQFRRENDNLYQRVRALFFLYAIHRFHMPTTAGVKACGRVPFDGYKSLLMRRFEEAIEAFLDVQRAQGPSDPTASALEIGSLGPWAR